VSNDGFERDPSLSLISRNDQQHQLFSKVRLAFAAPGKSRRPFLDLSKMPVLGQPV
jgi:hypothetical protein